MGTDAVSREAEAVQVRTQARSVEDAASQFAALLGESSCHNCSSDREVWQIGLSRYRVRRAGEHDAASAPGMPGVILPATYELIALLR